jgi:hypothetical protein
LISDHSTNTFYMYQEFVKEVLDFYGIAGGLGQASSTAAAAAIVDLEANISSTVAALRPFFCAGTWFLTADAGTAGPALGCAQSAAPG